MFRTKRRPRPVLPTARPRLESLEDRYLLAGNVLQTNLVSDLPGVAQFQDPQLINPWGIAEGPGGPFWISDNNAGVSTLYNTQGVKQGLVVDIPIPGNPASASGAPDGTVFNTTLLGSTPGFTVTDGIHSGPAIFLFATEDGTIVGWNPGVDPTGQFSGPKGASTHAVIPVDNSGNNFTEPNPLKQTGAVYKGLSIATSATPIFAGDPASTAVLYAANFRSGKIEVYDSKFKLVTTLPMGAFTDSNIPAGFAPFNVQALGGKIYVTYALQNAAKHDDVAGPGNGFIDVFNLDGTPAGPHGQPRLASRGPLDSPWGLALAPSSFGSLAGDLLVGNFGNGHINIFNPTSGTFVGQLKDPDGEPIVIPGLWTLKVGNGNGGGDANTVYFTAGIGDESHGLFGSLTPVAPGTPEGPAEAQMVQAALDIAQLDFATVLKDVSSGVTGAQLKQDIQAFNQALVQLVRAESQFAQDEISDGATGASGLDLGALENLFADLASLR